MKRSSFIFFCIVLIVALGVWGCRAKTPTTPRGKVDILFYNLFDDEDVFRPLIQEFQSKNKNVKIKYKKFTDVEEYEDLIMNELAEGKGPDIFVIHNTWLPKHLKKITPLESQSLTPEKYGEIFVDVVSKNFVQPDPKDGVAKIYGVPLFVDTLALYYNKKIFEKKLPERGKPGSIWKDIQEDAPKLREEGEEGALELSPIALGRADNIRLAPDILWNLFLQQGGSFYDDTFSRATFGSGGHRALSFFANFADPKKLEYSWNEALAGASGEWLEVEPFLRGKTLAIFGYASLLPELEIMLKNVKAVTGEGISMKDIAVAPSPQWSDDEADYKVWASYFGLVVSRNAKHPKEAWDFIQFLGSKEKMRFYHEKTKRPTSRRDLIPEQKREPLLSTFVSQLGYAESFPLMNDRRYREVFIKVIQSVVEEGKNAGDAIREAEEEINRLLPEEGLYPRLPKSKDKKK